MAAKGLMTILYQLLSIGPFPKRLAPKTSLQGPLWPSRKFFSLKAYRGVRLIEVSIKRELTVLPV